MKPSSDLLVDAPRPLESVLVVSVRSFRHQAANGSMYEFENVISNLCKTTLCCPDNEMPVRRKLYRSFKYIGLSDRVSDELSAMDHVDVLENHHDLILLVLDNPWQMHLLNQVKGWREHPAKKVCYITECWPKEFSNWRLLMEPFDNFDHIFLGLASSVPVLSHEISVPCSYLPIGVDTTVFVDQQSPCDRVIDVSYIGRREKLLHDELKRFTDSDGLFYLFDTARSQKLFVDDPSEHRKMYSSMLRRTRISLALPAKSNAAEETGGVDEVSTRFFEFAAAGVIIVGRSPNSDVFHQFFDWQDAVTNIGNDYEKTPDIIRQVLSEKQLMDTISKRNIVQSLQKNDWVYRFMDMAKCVGFGTNSRMTERVRDLNRMVSQLASV